MPRAAGFEAVIQHAVEHVTAFSASLEQRRAEAQLEQALTVCPPVPSLLHSFAVPVSVAKAHAAPHTDATADPGRQSGVPTEAACVARGTAAARGAAAG